MTDSESTSDSGFVRDQEFSGDPAIRKELVRLAQEEEEEKKARAVAEALAKFNVMIHVTGYISGCAFLVILGILFPAALPYVFIPIGLWTIGLVYHGYRAFKPRRKTEDVSRSR